MTRICTFDKRVHSLPLSAEFLTVVAGKEWWASDGSFEENIKYVESFNTLDEAIVAYLNICNDHDICRIEYKDFVLVAGMRRK